MENKVFSLLTDKLDKISDFKIDTTNLKEMGKVTKINDYILNVEGFSRILFNECVIVNNSYYGIVMYINGNISKIILLNKTDDIKVGDCVLRTGKTLEIGVSNELIGRIVDGIGNLIDKKENIKYNKYYKVEKDATKIIDRQAVNQPLNTGIKVIDSLIPIGKGQRELILGDRQTGKTSIAIDTILNQKNSNVVCIYCSIGQRDSSMSNVIKTLQDNDAMKYTIIVLASDNETAGHQFIAPYTATAIGEYFMNTGKDVLIVYDDLTKHAKSYREISLLLGKIPGREAYPADIFYIHSKLLERSAKIKDSLGGGSITSLPIIETEADDISAYIPTNVISITDGQIYLNSRMMQKGIFPAVDTGKSVSRIGGAAQLKAYKQVLGTLGIEYAQFKELEEFSRFSTNIDTGNNNSLNRGKVIGEFFKQNLHEIFKDYEQIAILLCLNNGLMDNIEPSNIEKAENVIVDTINSDFPHIKDIVRGNQKIDAETIDNILKTIKLKLNNFYGNII